MALSSEQVKTTLIMAAVVVVLGGLIILIPWVWVLSVLFVVLSVLMMGVILLQKPRGGGLSGAFGGAGGSAQAAFGAKTGDVLTGVTVVFFALFLVSAVKLTWDIRPSLEQARQEAQADAADVEEQVEQAVDTATQIPPLGVDVEEPRERIIGEFQVTTPPAPEGAPPGTDESPLVPDVAPGTGPSAEIEQPEGLATPEDQPAAETQVEGEAEPAAAPEPEPIEPGAEDTGGQAANGTQAQTEPVEQPEPEAEDAGGQSANGAAAEVEHVPGDEADAPTDQSDAGEQAPADESSPTPDQP